MPFLGGALWLDLANSSFSLDGTAFDFLADDISFANWCSAAGLSFDSANVSRERLAAYDLRELARAVLIDLGANRIPRAEHIDAINAILAQRGLHELLVVSDRHISLHMPVDIAGPEVAAALASDLAHFLADYEPIRLKSCDNPTCAMVFYDRGKNNRRRWCTMSICGNRDKVAKYRARQAGTDKH